MDTELIIKDLHRILDEKITDIIKIQKRISTLNYQIEHFTGMHQRYKLDVINDLIKDIEAYQKNSNLNWDNTLDEIKKQKNYCMGGD